jgi:RHS repeat-associated protein
MATFCDMAYTWDANKNKTSESITGGMSGYGFTSAGTTYDNEDLCISSSLPPPASSLLVDIDANGTADVNFQYDALGSRVARSGTGGSVVYVQMEQQTIADYPVGGAATTPTFRYVYASYIDEPVVRKTAGTGGTLVYFHRNHQYSVTAVTSSTGVIAERYAYTAYGQPTILDASASVLSSSAINNRYTYTGREWDATLALHHFRARWMSPSAGRFLTRDPIGWRAGQFSIYAYLNDRP